MKEGPRVATLAVDGSDGGTAALAVNGTLVAAAEEACAHRCTERTFRHESGSEEASITSWAAGLPLQHRAPIHAIAGCLRRAGCKPESIQRIAIVDGGEISIAAPASHDQADAPALVSVNGLEATAWQLAAFAQAPPNTVVLATDGPRSALVRLCRKFVTVLEPIEIGQLAEAIAIASYACGGDGSFDAIEQHGAHQSQTAMRLFDDVLAWDVTGGITVDHRALSGIFTSIRGSGTGMVRPDHQAIVAAFRSRLATVLSTFVRALRQRFGSQPIGFAGPLFANAGVRAILVETLGPDALFVPFPAHLGRVAGAAVLGCRPTAPLRTRDLGPTVTETDVKATLDNCRLDYVYEPDWQRLLLRTSRMLSRGNVVAWCHGSAPFGPQPDPSRATLCDPSKPFARENMNRFLRLADLNDPLTLFVAEDDAQDVVAAPVLSTLMTHRASPREGFRERLRGALDQRGHLSVQLVGRESATLYRLLQQHRAETGVPGLIASVLGNDAPACSPRDAIRATFSSAVDALVIERFLVMKDWWLLRSNPS